MRVPPSQKAYCLLQCQYGMELGGIFLFEVNYNHVLDLTPEDRAQYVQANEAIFKQMLQNIGDESAILRDQQNYRLFIQLLSENAIPQHVLHQFVEYLASDKGLLFQIGAKNGNSIFQRSFSALFLTAIVNADRQLQILSQQEIDHIAEKGIALFKNEQDLRSYVNEDAGWAHAIPNAADLLCAIIQHPNYPIRMTAQILQAIRANLWKDYVYTDDEEERFCMIVESILNKGIDEALLIEWFEQLYEQLEMIAYERGYQAFWFKARTNLLNVSKTLYFHLKFSNRHDQLRGIVSMFIQRWLKMS
jgi:hypothetical protein